MPQPPLTATEEEKYWEDNRPALVGSLTTFLVLNNLCVLSRLWVQWKSSRRFFADDVAIFAAALCVNTVCSCLLVSTHFGLGLHTWRINKEDPKVAAHLSDLFIYVWIVMIFTGPTFTAIKISLLFFYKRLFLVHQRWLYIAWWINLVYVVLWFIGTTAYYLFQCSKPEWYFLHYYKDYHEPIPGKIQSGQCNAESVTHTSLPIILGLVSDVAILCLPLVAISSLQMNKKKKTAMALLFAIGTLACTLELVRIIALRIGTDDKKDPSWGDVNFLILSAAEEVTALMCACLPVIGPYFVKELRSFRKSYSQRGASTRYRYSQGGSRGFKRFVSSDNQLEDTEALRSSENNKSGDEIELVTADKAHVPKKPVSDGQDKLDTVLVRTEVEVTTEQHHGRTRDPLALPPLGEHEAPQTPTWRAH